MKTDKSKATRDAEIVSSNSDLLHLLGSPESPAATIHVTPMAPVPVSLPPETAPPRPRLPMIRENSV